MSKCNFICFLFFNCSGRSSCRRSRQFRWRWVSTLFIYLFISLFHFRWTKKISFCGLSLFKNVNIVGNPGSCGNDWMSWRELKITQQSQCAIPSRRLNILPALPVYPLLSDITGPLLKSWRPTLKSRSTAATHIFHGRYVEWWMDPFMLLNYDFGSQRTIREFMRGKDSALYRCFCVSRETLSMDGSRWPFGIRVGMDPLRLPYVGMGRFRLYCWQ